MSNIIKNTVYAMDFARGAMVPLENGNLPVGQIISYEDMANPRKEFVIVGNEAPGRWNQNGQIAVCLVDGHESTIHFAGGKISGHWTIEGRVMNSDEMALALAEAKENGHRLADESAEARKVESNRQAVQRAEWDRTMRHLEKVPAGGHASAKQGAKNIRTELKQAFPGVKFSVTSDHDSIDIHWDLGPMTSEVEKISGKYSKGNFDGMTDSYDYDHGNQWPDIYGGARYVFEHRGQGGAVELIAGLLCDAWKLARPADGKSFWNIRRADDCSGHDVGVSARQIVDSISYPAGAIITGLEHCAERREDVDHCSGWACWYRPIFSAQSVEPANSPETPADSNAALRYNREKSGIEIRFPAKPSASVLAELKANGWRWARFSGCWYARASEAALSLAEKLTGTKADDIRARLAGNAPAVDRFDMQVEDNMRDACGC